MGNQALSGGHLAMRVLVISHEPTGGAGLVGEILRERGFDVVTHVVLEDPQNPNTDYPNPDDFDAVMAFGSFFSAYEPKARPWVEPEVDLLRTLLDRDIPYLGVCFGGQLLAEALGGHVEAAPPEDVEMGLMEFPAAQGVPSGPWFSWHGDRVVLPPDVDVVAENERAVQVFRKGRAAGTQFHPEANVPLVSLWVRDGSHYLPSEDYGDQLLNELAASEAELRKNCEELVDWFLADVAELSTK